MKKIIIALLVCVPSLLLSSCYVSSYPGSSYYTGYSPGWNNTYYSSNYVVGNGGWNHVGWGNAGWGHGGWGHGGWGHGSWGHGGWGHGGHRR